MAISTDSAAITFECSTGKARTVFYISEYEVTREYGGPEEGGWWYDWRDYVRVICHSFSEDSAYALCRGMNRAERERAERDGEYPLSSVLADSVRSFTVESEPGEEQSTSVPFYE